MIDSFRTHSSSFALHELTTKKCLLPILIDRQFSAHPSRIFAFVLWLFVVRLDDRHCGFVYTARLETSKRGAGG
jgi:hypothetical protein